MRSAGTARAAADLIRTLKFLQEVTTRQREEKAWLDHGAEPERQKGIKLNVDTINPTHIQILNVCITTLYNEITRSI